MTTETTFRPIMWEPVSGTGERLMAGVIVEQHGEISTHRIIRDDILDALYGKATSSPSKLIDAALSMYLNIAKESGINELSAPILGLSAGEIRHISANSLTEAVRISALMYSSLANMVWIDELEAEDSPSQEDTNKRFFTEVKNLVLSSNPLLANYFNRSAKLLNDGQNVKFGYLSDTTVLHFNVLSANRQPSGVRDSRARLWELARARDYGSIAKAALITATTSDTDPTLSQKQIDAMRANLNEINREADSEQILFYPVHSVNQGAEKVLALSA